MHPIERGEWRHLAAGAEQATPEQVTPGQVAAEQVAAAPRRSPSGRAALSGAVVSGVALATMVLGASTSSVAALGGLHTTGPARAIGRVQLAAAAAIVVQPGDTLWSLAQRYGTTVAALAAANGISDPNLIVAGTRLRLPGSGGTAVTQAVVTSDVAPPATEPSAIVVQPGDTLWSLAQRYGTTVAALAAANGISDPNLIVAGTRLRLPGSGGTAVTQAVVTSDVVRAPDGGSLSAAFSAAASEEGVSVALLKAITWQESGWNNAAVSPAGAIGMGQLMPATIDFVNAVLVNPPLDPSVPAENLVMTAAFLRYLGAQTGSLEGTICAYYQGLGSYQRFGVLPESRQYVADVMALLHRFGS